MNDGVGVNGDEGEEEIDESIEGNNISLEIYQNRRMEEIADTIPGGLGNRYPREGTELKISERAALYTGGYTGVEVKFMSSRRGGV